MSYFNELPEIDRQIIEAVIDDTLAAGLCISVHDGEEIALSRSVDRAQIIGALCTTDDDTLIIRRIEDGAPKKEARVGSVYLVYGNEPGVVICDHTDTPQVHALLARATKLGDEYDERGG